MTVFVAKRRVSRRAWLTGSGAVAGGAAIDAFALEPNWLDVTRHEVAVTGLPQGLDGFAVAQVTDAHLNGIGAVEERVADTLRNERVQLIVLTGDIIDSEEKLPVLLEFCHLLRASGATILATLGNWEHWGRVPVTKLTRAYRDVAVRLLVNDVATLADGVRIFATDDSTGGQGRLVWLEGRADAQLLLTHSPAFLDRVPREYGRDVLALAGHTHGGQVRLGQHAVPFTPPGSGRFVAGWYSVPYGSAYVSRGTGTSVVPARFTCRPELPIFRLRQG